MHDTAALLEAIKARNGLQSDYALAKRLGIAANRVSGYRSGRSRPDDVTAATIAEAAGLDVAYVLACLHAERSHTAEARELWKSVAARFEHAAAVVFSAVILSAGLVASPDASAMVRAPSQGAAEAAGLYIMSTARRMLRRMLALLAVRQAPTVGRCPAV